MSAELPGYAPGRIRAVFDALETEEKQEAFLRHLLGGTSAEWLADTLTLAGYPLGQTTIKSYRRALREAGVQV